MIAMFVFSRVAQSRGHVGRGWLQAERYTVTPLASIPYKCKAVSRTWTSAIEMFTNDIVVCIAMCTGCGDPTMKTYACSPAALASHGGIVGVGKTFHFSIPGRVNEQVIVMDVQCRVDTVKFCKTLESERCFLTGCWYALRLWHRARRLGISEARAESWGSTLAYLHDRQQGHMSGSNVDRLTVKAAGVRGNGLDDVLVQRVARCIRGSTCASARSLCALKKKGFIWAVSRGRRFLTALHFVGAFFKSSVTDAVIMRWRATICINTDMASALASKLHHAHEPQRAHACPRMGCTCNFTGAIQGI